MQTFIVYRDYEYSANALDNIRLNKQLIECFQIYQVLLGNKTGWANHPCVLMWKDNIDSFLSYCYYNAKEAKNRKINNKFCEYFMTVGNPSIRFPKWLDEDFCVRHRGALLFKTALKATVYDFSLLYNTPVNLVNKDVVFKNFIDEHNRLFYLSSLEINKHYPVGKSIYNYKRIASIKMISNAYQEYASYKMKFGAIEHKIDYRWG